MATRKSSTKNPFLTLLPGVQKQVERRLSATLKSSLKTAEGYGPEVVHMVEAVRSLSERGGKRLRPALCVVGGIAVDEKIDKKPLFDAGVSLELLQAYFLIHDDWMDEDAERRGGPTAHVELAKKFRSRFLGERAAILAGDHAVSLAQAHLGTLAVSPKRMLDAFATFAEMQLAAVAGQQVDIIGKTTNPELTYELKTASYTVLGPLKLGAQLAGAKKSTLDALAGYGLPAGIAFQHADDLLGVFGDSKKTGKPRGADLTAGKNTSLVQAGLRRLKGQERTRLKELLAGTRATQKQVEGVVELLEACGARAEIKERIAVLRAEALSALDVSEKVLSKKARAHLEGAALALTERDA